VENIIDFAAKLKLTQSIVVGDVQSSLVTRLPHGGALTTGCTRNKSPFGPWAM
jgi:hypothetical protein